jgi:hypothetical protein
MSDLDQELKDLETQFDEALKKIEDSSKQPQLPQPQQKISYEELLRLKGAYERIIEQQMDMIRFMGEAATQAGIDFRDFQR